MASKTGFKWRNAAFREVRTLPSVRRELERRARKIASDAGPGFESDSGVTGGRGRARASVYPATAKAARDNAANNSLLRALGRNS